jgi:tRNA (guanine-N7-)-methyltransferase
MALPSTAHRPIRSFVRREGRITPAQRRALDELWPRYGVPAGEGPLDPAALYGRVAPLELEIGFGNGEALAALAAAHPERDYLGLEVHRPGVGALLARLAAAGLTNVRVAAEDAAAFVARRLPDGALAAAYLFFPDPWPKKRHHKRRLVQAPFAALLARKLAPGGVLRLATDWPDYAAHMLAVLAAEPALENLAADGGYAPRPEERPLTKFERRGLRLGHPVRDLAFRRRAPGAA